MKTTKKSRMSHWERNEHIISQRVIKLPGGRYKHIEIVKYPKKKRRYK